MVYRCFSEKRAGFDVEAREIFADLSENLGITSLENVRVLNRYDVEGIKKTDYITAKATVFSDPACDNITDEVLSDEVHRILVVEPLPGQFDQRADSCAQCIQLLVGGTRARVASAKVYILDGDISDTDFDKIKNYLINPVESRQASMDKPVTLKQDFGSPPDIAVLNGFISLTGDGLRELLNDFGLAMDIDDLTFLQEYFKKEGRDPTETEIRVVDTYWSDHCRHTTFGTHLTELTFNDPRVKRSFDRYLGAREELYGGDTRRPITLMDMATAAMKLLRARGELTALDESEEINACSIEVEIEVDGQPQQWLLMFKNETHNHPTEIEPFGGAATCIGGAIRDPLSGRSYVYQAMRVTGAADPRVPVSETREGKLPQRKLTNTAAAGYSSYGNQIGLATGIVHEFYHPGYMAKRMEIGAVVGAVKKDSVTRERPVDGDIVVLVGGRTGRDGIGGATGSSKTHDLKSLDNCASEVQKGNPPEERKLQRLFRDPDVARIIKRCNDFGAGGVSVAIGELSDGLKINLDKVPKKYEGLDGTELAISESQERMAVVVAPESLDYFITAAGRENLEAIPVAVVTEEARLMMEWRGKTIVDISREFLNTNGAPKSAKAHILLPRQAKKSYTAESFSARMTQIMGDLRHCGTRGLTERFDASIGAGSVLMPFGGVRQRTPAQVMAALFPVLKGQTEDCSVMSFAFDPWLSEVSPYDGAADAVTRSVAKLIAAGARKKDIYLTFQEYFPRLYDDKERWGLPVAALLGAFEAQCALGAAAIGGKDSMSGSFLDMDVPPTLVSFAIAHMKAGGVISNELKGPGHYLYLLDAGFGRDGLPDFRELTAIWDNLAWHIDNGRVLSAMVPESGGEDGLFAALAKMCFGNGVGIDLCVDTAEFDPSPGAIIVEASDEISGPLLIGMTTGDGHISLDGESVSVDELCAVWEGTLERVFPTKTRELPAGEVPVITYPAVRPAVGAAKKLARPKAVVPVFPGTNCEYDTCRVLEEAGASAETLLVRNLSPEALAESARELEKAIRSAQMMVIPGGFSGGDEPDGSGKFIAAFLRGEAIADALNELLYKRDGLILGICNGFQALVKLGLLPYGEIRAAGPGSPTLTYNLIGRHQSRYITTRVASVKSPWLAFCEPGELHAVPISHGEGRFMASEKTLEEMRENGQIAFQYTDNNGLPGMDIDINPNGSVWSIEGITSPDGRVLGKMGHSERRGSFIAKNITGNKFQPIFEGGVRYFK